jgi:hypothetical protein
LIRSLSVVAMLEKLGTKEELQGASKVDPAVASGRC